MTQGGLQPHRGAPGNPTRALARPGHRSPCTTAACQQSRSQVPPGRSCPTCLPAPRRLSQPVLSSCSSSPPPPCPMAFQGVIYITLSRAGSCSSKGGELGRAKQSRQRDGAVPVLLPGSSWACQSRPLHPSMSWLSIRAPSQELICFLVCLHFHSSPSQPVLVGVFLWLKPQILSG